MEWVLIALVAVLVVLAVRGGNRRQIAQTRRRDAAPDELAGVKRAADEDVTEFGEELQRLDIDLAGRELDAATRADYQRGLDAYESAKESVQAVRSPDEIRNVTEILEDGRYATACVRARVEGQPLPARRSPCFFNPQHGPSVRDVTWTPSGGSAREVPACALDAQRVEAGAEPDSRKVMVGSRRVPYWEAGPAYGPWAAGYFATFGVMNVLFLGTMMGSLGGFDGSYDQGYDEGYDAGQDGSGGDGGGDAGGGDGGSDYSAGGDYSGDMGGGGWDGGGSDFGGGFDGGGFDGGGF